MDIFNKNRVAELERENRGLMSENEDLKSALYHAEEQIKDLLKTIDHIPEDCKPGPYCAGCGFAKEYRYHNRVRGSTVFSCYETRLNGYICGKGEICKNFVQKEIAE